MAYLIVDCGRVAVRDVISKDHLINCKRMPNDYTVVNLDTLELFDADRNAWLKIPKQ